jgi:hypothetical protein
MISDYRMNLTRFTIRTVQCRLDRTQNPVRGLPTFSVIAREAICADRGNLLFYPFVRVDHDFTPAGENVNPSAPSPVIESHPNNTGG